MQIKLAQSRAEENNEIAARSNDWKKYLGQFAGAAYGSLDDPVIQSTIGTWRNHAWFENTGWIDVS